MADSTGLEALAARQRSRRTCCLDLDVFRSHCLVRITRGNSFKHDRRSCRHTADIMLAASVFLAPGSSLSAGQQERHHSPRQVQARDLSDLKTDWIPVVSLPARFPGQVRSEEGGAVLPGPGATGPALP